MQGGPCDIQPLFHQYKPLKFLDHRFSIHPPLQKIIEEFNKSLNAPKFEYL